MLLCTVARRWAEHKEPAPRTIDGTGGGARKRRLRHVRWQQHRSHRWHRVRRPANIVVTFII